MRIATRLAVISLITFSIFGQQTASERVQGVLSMAQAGLSDDLIMAKLRKEAKPIDLSTEDMIALKKAKVSDAVVRTMLDPTSAPAAPAASTLVPGITGLPKASGATPGATDLAGDPNDPMAAHDSGIYVVSTSRDGKTTLVILERASYQGSKTGGILLSGMTYGIAKAKNRAVIPGPKAPVRVAVADPVFYFYFDDKQAGLGKSGFGASSLSNPNQFALLKLEVNKGNRETVIGQFSALGASSGTDAKAMVPFKSERLKPGLYKVSVTGLKPGEYCFLASGGNMGAMAAGAAGAADIFDFGVSIE